MGVTSGTARRGRRHLPDHSNGAIGPMPSFSYPADLFGQLQPLVLPQPSQT